MNSVKVKAKEHNNINYNNYNNHSNNNSNSNNHNVMISLDNNSNCDDEDEDEIIINDEYYDEPSNINTIPSKQIIPSSLLFKKQNEHIVVVPSSQPKINETQTSSEHEELFGYSQFVYFIKENEEITDHIETKYLEELTKFKEQVTKLKEDNLKLKMMLKKHSQTEKKKQQETDQHKHSEHIQTLYDKLKTDYNTQKEQIETSLTNNKLLSKQLEEQKNVNDTLQFEIKEKTEMINTLNNDITALQDKVKELESDNVNNELQLKINELMKCNNELTTRITEIQMQFDNSIIKIQQLTDENFSLKQTLIKAASVHSSSPKAKTIVRSDNEQQQQQQQSSPLLSPCKSKANFNSIRIDNNHNTIDQCNTPTSPVPKSALTQSKSQTRIGKKIKASSINDPSFTTSLAIFPSQREQLMKESKILEIESALYKLQKERDKLNDDLSKIPEFPKQKIQINKRRSLEYAIEEYNTKINTHKQKLRELNG